MTTLCRDCDLVHSETRKLPPSRWACMAAPRPLDAPYPELDPDWLPSPPYELCRYLRVPGTDCPNFKPRRVPT